MNCNVLSQRWSKPFSFAKHTHIFMRQVAVGMYNKYPIYLTTEGCFQVSAHIPQTTPGKHTCPSNSCRILATHTCSLFGDCCLGWACWSSSCSRWDWASLTAGRSPGRSRQPRHSRNIACNKENCVSHGAKKGRPPMVLLLMCCDVFLAYLLCGS